MKKIEKFPDMVASPPARSRIRRYLEDHGPQTIPALIGAFNKEPAADGGMKISPGTVRKAVAYFDKNFLDEEVVVGLVTDKLGKINAVGIVFLEKDLPLVRDGKWGRLYLPDDQTRPRHHDEGYLRNELERPP